MFVGHYGVSFAAKRYAPRASLGVLFLAVQLLDVLFAIFVSAGIEKLRIVPGFTAYNPYELYYMPYSHSLVGALVWALAAGVLMFPLQGRDVGTWIGVAVFSHFVLDVPMHTPDLPVLGNDSPKIGLGLWRHRDLSLAAELIALGIGFWIYWRGTHGSGSARVGPLLFATVLVALTIATPFFPAPPSGEAFALQALASYVVLALLAAWADRRVVRPARP